MVTKTNEENIKEQFSSIKMVKLLTNIYQNIYGLTCQKEIYIKKDIQNEFGFTKDVLIQLFTSHELGHIIHSSWKEDEKNFIHSLYQEQRVQTLLKKMDLASPKYLEYGFDLLDEATTEEVAERVIYHYLEEDRPEKTYRNDKKILDYKPYLTNYTIYGEFQEITIQFAKTLSFLNIKQEDSDDEILKKLCQKSFRKDFIQFFEKELMVEPEKLDSFVVMLSSLGRIFEATYQVLNLKMNDKPIVITPYLSIFQKVAAISSVDRKEENKKKM